MADLLAARTQAGQLGGERRCELVLLLGNLEEGVERLIDLGFPGSRKVDRLKNALPRDREDHLGERGKAAAQVVKAAIEGRSRSVRVGDNVGDLSSSEPFLADRRRESLEHPQAVSDELFGGALICQLWSDRLRLLSLRVVDALPAGGALCMLASCKGYAHVLFRELGNLGRICMLGDMTLASAMPRTRTIGLFAGALLAAVMMLLSVTGLAHADAGDAVITSAERVQPRVVELTIDTPAFSTPTKVQVDLPTGYDDNPGRRWPTSYFLAGTQNNYRSFNSIINGVALTANYPAIVVSPNGDSGYWSDWYNRSVGGPPMYETYVIDQLIPLIDSYFRTIPDRAHRAVAGVSMGGYGALMLAARHPDLFGSAASISGTLNTNLLPNAAAVSISSALQGGDVDAIYGPRLTQEVRWRGHNPADLAENLRGMDVQVRTANGVLNMGIGENPFSADLVSCVVEAGVYAASVSMHGILDKLGVPHLWKDYGAGCHTPPNFKRQTIDTLAVFARNFAAAGTASAPTRFDYKSIEPSFDVWGWHVDADSRRALEFMDLDDVDSTGITLTGSGRTTITTPPLFQGKSIVWLSGATDRWTRPDTNGRISFTVDLGAPDQIQQYRLGAWPFRMSQTVRFFSQ